MGEFEERLNSILSDPGQMEKIASMASKLMGGETQEESGFGSDMMAKLGTMLSGGNSDKTALLRAMEPYISPERRARLHKAAQLARAATIAGTLFRQEGGDGA